MKTMIEELLDVFKGYKKGGYSCLKFFQILKQRSVLNPIGIRKVIMPIINDKEKEIMRQKELISV